METNKYFTPSIEDIRVGYECEVKPINEKFDWKPAVLKYNPGHESSDSKSLYNLKPFWWTYREEENGWPLVIQIPNLSHLRVSYLTKEQIEDEGWKFFDDNQKHAIKNKIVVRFDFGKTALFGKDNGEILFQGECKDINTFRYICKLLQIND